MKRSNQVMAESVIIAALLLGIVFAGAASTSSLPNSWLHLQNPNAVQAQSNLTSIAIFYNGTLTSLSMFQFQSVEQSLVVFQFLVIPPSLIGTTQNANGEIGSMNQSLPLAQYYLNQTEYLYNIGAFSNASQALNSFCFEVGQTNATLNQFNTATSASLSSRGVPVAIYRPPIVVLQNEINSYYSNCLLYRSKLLHSVSTLLTISSDQTPFASYGRLWVYTGSELNLTATLEENGFGVSGQSISFHVEGQGPSPSTLTTGSSGSTSGSLRIPYFYQQFIRVWATAEANASSGTSYAVSNVLNLTLLYNQTQIIIQDPPKVLPTFQFTISGVLKDNFTGTPLSDAPVRITSFNESYYTTTNSNGIFTDTLIVPANATNGIHYIYASFAPQGAYGPSFNFTSIIVYRLPLNVTLAAPSLVIPGFPSSLSGVAKANGSVLANAQLVLYTPFGSYHVTTDSSGKFSTPLSIPMTEFAFNKQIVVSVSPTEPYISGTTSYVALTLLNLITVVVITCVLGFGVYYARKLGINLSIRKKGQVQTPDGEILEREQQGQIAKSSAVVIPALIGSFSSPMVAAYIEALSLATKKLGINFAKNMTIRETIDLVQSADKEGRGVKFFSAIALTTEDYLYSKVKSDPEIEERIKIVRDSLSNLRKLWGA
jgi:hypothetical protein